MNLLPIILFGVFAIMLALRVPIAFALGISSMCCLAYTGVPLSVMAQRVYGSLDSYPLMAIPLFILAGNIMTVGGISKRLTDIAATLLERFQGGLALACVLACGFFAALSGSGPATVVAIGSMMYPGMVEKGYPRNSVAGLVTVSGGLGPIIPPSIHMVLYGTLTDTSISGLFAAGAICGAVMLISLLSVTYMQAKKHAWPSANSGLTVLGKIKVVGKGFWALVMPVVVLGGIYGGFMTPTEAAGFAVVYAIVVSAFIYRSLTMQSIMAIFKDSAVASSVILFVIATSSVFSWFFAYAGLTDILMGWLTSLNLGYYGILLFITVVLLVFGFFLDGVSTLLLLIPIMMPLAMSVGISPIHLGMIVTITNVVGCMTPPVAVNLFACSTFTGLPVESIAKGEMPYLITMTLVLLAIVFFFPLTGM